MKYIDYQWHEEVQERRETQEKQNKSTENGHTDEVESYFILVRSREQTRTRSLSAWRQ